MSDTISPCLKVQTRNDQGGSPFGIRWGRVLEYVGCHRLAGTAPDCGRRLSARLCDRHRQGRYVRRTRPGRRPDDSRPGGPRDSGCSSAGSTRASSRAPRPAFRPPRQPSGRCSMPPGLPTGCSSPPSRGNCSSWARHHQPGAVHSRAAAHFTPRTAGRMRPARRQSRPTTADHPRGPRHAGVPDRLRAAQGLRRTATRRAGPAQVWLLPNPSGLQARYGFANMAAMYEELRRAADRPGRFD